MFPREAGLHAQAILLGLAFSGSHLPGSCFALIGVGLSGTILCWEWSCLSRSTSAGLGGVRVRVTLVAARFEGGKLPHELGRHFRSKELRCGGTWTPTVLGLFPAEATGQLSVTGWWTCLRSLSSAPDKSCIPVPA